jgi:hypothetical protein
MRLSLATKFAVAVAILTVTGCVSGANPNQLLAPTATPLATEPPEFATDSPKATKVPAPTKTPRTGSFYRPPGWDGHSDVDCADFDTQAHAESFFKGTGGSRSNDPYHLDSNHDGVACESLP